MQAEEEAAMRQAQAEAVSREDYCYEADKDVATDHTALALSDSLARTGHPKWRRSSSGGVSRSDGPPPTAAPTAALAAAPEATPTAASTLSAELPHASRRAAHVHTRADIARH